MLSSQNKTEKHQSARKCSRTPKSIFESGADTYVRHNKSSVSWERNFSNASCTNMSRSDYLHNSAASKQGSREIFSFSSSLIVFAAVRDLKRGLNGVRWAREKL